MQVPAENGAMWM